MEYRFQSQKLPFDQIFFKINFPIPFNFQLIKKSCFQHWHTSPLITM